MIDKDFIKTSGFTEAQEMMIYLRKLGASSTAAVLYSDPRPSGKASNGEIIEYLKEGVKRRNGQVVKRDVTPTKEDADRAAQTYWRRAENRLKALANKSRVPKPPKKIDVFGVEKLAENAQASGLKAGANILVEAMGERVQEGVQSDGSWATLVEPGYARRRQEQYGVGPDEVFKASGQLLRNLEREKIRLDRTTGLADMAKKFLGVS